MQPAQTRREQTLRVLNEAALAVQQASTPEQVYKAVASGMQLLGYRTFFLMLSPTRQHLRIEHMTVPSDIVAHAEALTGAEVRRYRLSVAAFEGYLAVLDQRETVFAPDLIPTLSKALLADVQSLAEEVTTLFVSSHGILAPLVVADQVKGVLVATAHTLGQEDIPVVTAFADQVSAALERARLFAELQEREWRATVAYEVAQQYAQELEDRIEQEQARLREISALHTVAAVTAEELVAETVMERGLRAIKEIFDLDGAAIYYVDRDEQLHLSSAQGEPRSFLAQIEGDPPQLREMYAGPEILSGRSVLIEDLDTIQDPLATGIRETGVRTVANLPLRAGGRLIGVMALNSQRPQALTSGDVPLLTSIASQFATSLENARLFEQEQERRAGLDRLNEALRLFAEQLQQCEAESAVAQLLCEVVARAQGWQNVVVALLNPVLTTWSPAAQVGYGQWQASLFPPPPMPVPWMQEEFRISHSYCVSEPSLLYPEWEREARDHTGLPYFLAVPLEAGDRVLGVLLPTHQADNSLPTRRQIEHLELFASQAAIALESVRLSRSLRMWANAVQHSGDAILITDMEGQIISVNPAFESLTGYGQREVAGQSFRILDSGVTSPEVFDDMWSTVLDGGTWRGELVSRRQDSSVYDADLTVAPILDPAGRFAGLVASQRDISRIKELDRLKTEFVSNVSHELRTPLTNIKLYQRYLREGRRPDLHEQFFDILERETNRLIGIIEDLLDLSRLEAGAISHNPRPLDWNDLVGSVVADHMVQTKEVGLDLSFQPADGRLRALAETASMTQVLTNLLTNALNYTPAGGQVCVSTGQGQGSVWVRVQDSGYGIHPEEMPQIFERFYRGGAAKDSGKPGTGLGLAIVKQILDLYDGRIQVASQVGQGTTFTVTMPAVEAETTIADILLVEDNPDILFLTRYQLEEQGYQVRPARSGEAALERLSEKMPDLMVLDLLLPRVSGLEVLEQLQTGEYGPPSPVLVLSGADASVAHQALALGGSEFLTKPYSPQVFLDVVSRLLQNRAQGER